MEALKLDRVSKLFGATTALHDVSFAIRRGTIVALLGPSGCGKTTTLRLIAGFEDPSTGTLDINGRSVVGLRPYERNIGLVFQDYALFPHMTVAENVAYGMRHRKIPKATIPQRTAHYLELVKMQGMENRYPRQLSGGQQQRVALARALATEPEILLLDEPLSALDAKLRVELQVELKAILKQAECTVIIVTHDQEEAMSLGEEIIIMNAGRIIQRGTPSDIYNRPVDRFVTEFVGRSNWFTGRLSSSDTQGAASLLTDDDLCIQVAAIGSDIGTRDAEICVRPERLVLTRECGSRSGDSGMNSFRVRIHDTVCLGAVVNIYVETPAGRRLLIERPNDGSQFHPGEDAHVNFHMNDCHLLPG